MKGKAKFKATWVFWPIVLALFAGLVVVRHAIPEVTKKFTSGIALNNALDNALDNDEVQFFGVVVEAKPKYTGFTTATIEADDGATVLVSIPPTCGAKVPLVGTRVNVIGKYTGPGQVTILDRKGIAPITDDMRCAEGNYQFLQDPTVADPGQTAWSYGVVQIVQTNANGSHKVNVVQDDVVVAHALMLATVDYPGSKETHAFLFTKAQDGTLLIKGFNK